MFGIKVKAAGKEWQLPPHPGPDAIISFRDWIAEQEGDPYADAEAAAKVLGQGDPLVKELVTKGRGIKEQLRCFTLKGPIAMLYLATEQGATQFFKFWLLEKYPDITDQEALAVAIAHGKAEEERKKNANAEEVSH
jgi:hypothetical protein